MAHRHPTTAQRGEEHQRQPRNRLRLLAPAARDTSSRGSGRIPALSVFCPRGALYFSPSATLSKLWWAAADTTIATS